MLIIGPLFYLQRTCGPLKSSQLYPSIQRAAETCRCFVVVTQPARHETSRGRECDHELFGVLAVIAAFAKVDGAGPVGWERVEPWLCTGSGTPAKFLHGWVGRSRGIDCRVCNSIRGRELAYDRCLREFLHGIRDDSLDARLVVTTPG